MDPMAVLPIEVADQDRASDQYGPPVDLRGNEVEAAAEEYRIGPGGGVYESHAPDMSLDQPAPATI
jgi:hypothetical protein